MPCFLWALQWGKQLFFSNAAYKQWIFFECSLLRNGAMQWGRHIYLVGLQAGCSATVWMGPKHLVFFLQNDCCIYRDDLLSSPPFTWPYCETTCVCSTDKGISWNLSCHTRESLWMSLLKLPFFQHIIGVVIPFLSHSFGFLSGGHLIYDFELPTGFLISLSLVLFSAQQPFEQSS